MTRNKNNGFWKKMAAGVTALGGLIGSLSGCGTEGRQDLGKGSKESQAAGAEKQTGQSGEAKGMGETTALGRYVEVEVELPPDIEEDMFVALFYGKDGKLELYTDRKENSEDVSHVCRFIKEGEDWREDEGWWEQVKPPGIAANIRRVFFGKDEKYYFTVMDAEDYVCHLYRVQEGEESTELISQVFEPEEGKKYGRIPQKWRWERTGIF